MNKDFDDWNSVKKKLDTSHTAPTFQKREIWWCSIGLNIGHEENGKNKDYSRPVLIVRKFNDHIFWGIPLTTQIKEKHYYHKIHFKEKEQCVMLSQIRLLESRRLNDKMGKISQKQFDEIREVLKGMI
jgi:mRNA interferase MazF